MRIRPRRLRKNAFIRALVCETKLSINDFIMPVFVIEGKNIKEEIKSMPGIFRFSPDRVLSEIDEIVKLGIKGVLLFGIPKNKDNTGSSAYDPNGVVQIAIKKIKQKYPSLYVISDICLCEYTSHGHCGVVKNNDVCNDQTLKILSKMALSHADAGVDMVAPSDMMDGRVGAIRDTLDKSGYETVAIMAYSAKYASCFYGPFRDIAECAPSFGDRKSYQMDISNRLEAKKEILLDINEGADIVMIKPALSYLDIICEIKDNINIPLAAYNVSGEYSMIKYAAKANILDENRAILEVLTSIKRAGADLIISYFAKDVLQRGLV